MGQGWWWLMAGLMLDLLYILGLALPALLLSALLTHWFPAWGKWRVALIAALTIPCVLWGLCLWLYVLEANTPPEHCGVDACGMGMMMAMVFAAMTVVVALMGMPFALLGRRWSLHRLHETRK